MKIEYVTDDGKRFETQKEANEYEKFVAKIESIMPDSVYDWNRGELFEFLAELVEENKIKII